MSKFKKKIISRELSLSELDIQFEKIIQFTGWIFLIALGGFMLSWVVFDSVMNLINLQLNAMTFTFIIFTGTNSAIGFGLASKIKNNRIKKKNFFYDWLIGEFLFCMFAIFAIAAYQW